jgi:hypothetical protein
VYAQASRTFKTRLSPVPVSAYNANVVGSGSVTATLTGTKLTISGNYDGLASPATIAKVFKSTKPGIRGDALFDLKVSGGTSGTITASSISRPRRFKNSRRAATTSSFIVKRPPREIFGDG